MCYSNSTMKKLLLGFATLTLLGAGCAGVLTGKPVTGEWALAFDMPEGWVMVQPYQASATPINIDGDIEATDSEVYVQSTSAHILTGGVGIEEDRASLFGDYLTYDDSWTQIQVLRLDPRRVIPGEAEDLGDGFFKETLCEEGGECTQYGASRFVYYLKTEGTNYKFTVLSSNADMTDAEEVILSAQVVEETVE